MYRTRRQQYEQRNRLNLSNTAVALNRNVTVLCGCCDKSITLRNYLRHQRLLLVGLNPRRSAGVDLRRK